MSSSKTFEADGFVFMEKAIEPTLLDRLEDVIVSRARVDLDEMGITHEGLAPFELLRAVEQNSRRRFYKLCSVGSAVAGLQIATLPTITTIVGDLFARDPSQIFTFPPAIYWNDRAVTRLQSKWHQESSYLGAYERIITLWFPLFRDLLAADGPMVVARGSHRDVYPYSFSKEPDGITQFWVADDVASRFEQVPCAIKRGDAVLFHRDLLHKTGENLSGTPRISVIVRYFDLLHVPEFEPLIVPNNITKKDAVAAKAVTKQ